MLLYLPICYAALLLKFIHYAQYYAQEQELWSEYYNYALYVQVCMNKLLPVADNFRNTVSL